MPAQELFLELQRALQTITVLKSYDADFAHEVFRQLDEDSIGFLSDSLHLPSIYDIADIPSRDSAEYADFIWQELEEAAREDGQVRSFFIVAVNTRTGEQRTPFVCADWPTAESFAKKLAGPE